MDHVDANDPVSRRDRPDRMQGVQGNGCVHIRDACCLHPCGDTQPCSGIRIGRLENKAWDIPGKMNGVFARATCDFKDGARCWEYIAKDIETEIRLRRVACVYWRSSLIKLTRLETSAIG